MEVFALVLEALLFVFVSVVSEGERPIQIMAITMIIMAIIAMIPFFMMIFYKIAKIITGLLFRRPL